MAWTRRGLLAFVRLERAGAALDEVRKGDEGDAHRADAFELLEVTAPQAREVAFRGAMVLHPPRIGPDQLARAPEDGACRLIVRVESHVAGAAGRAAPDGREDGEVRGFESGLRGLLGGRLGGALLHLLAREAAQGRLETVDQAQGPVSLTWGPLPLHLLDLTSPNPMAEDPKNPTVNAASLERYSEAELPTEYGIFRVFVYREGDKEHAAIVHGDIDGAPDVLCRVHSECLTGEVLHSLKCDCREQLDLAMRRIAEAKKGVVVYLRQEGRGIGLGNKIRAYALQAQGADTVDANTMLGFPPDLRRYDVAARILEDLRVRSIALMTNNPEKVDALIADGVNVTRRVNHHVDPTAESRGYLETKRSRLGHHLDHLGDGERHDLAELDAE